ncbi:HAD-IA family hydrolase, partial [Acinetobacter baumannii]|nr:HAD-IA family hydrolase [Acinetobacter baumannii]
MAGVYEDLTAFMYGDMLKASKPEPDIFLEAAKKLGQEPKDCVVIEDSISGVLAGKAAGGYVIYIPDIMKVP